LAHLTRIIAEHKRHGVSLTESEGAIRMKKVYEKPAVARQAMLSLATGERPISLLPGNAARPS
jgi:hypothetical protein